MSKVRWEKHFIGEICKQVDTTAEALRRIGLTPRGSNYKTFRSFTQRHEIDTSHFTGYAHSNRANLAKARAEKTKPLSEVMVENSAYSSTTLKRRLVKSGTLSYRCQVCGVESWMGRSLSLHLDHINGDPTDHRIENLRLLCPNCHSQTSTYCGRKNKTVSRSCAAKERPTKIRWPETDVLKQMVAKRGYESTGRLLGVSGNAVKKHMIKHA